MPIQLVECVVFLEGDDSDEIFRIMYPEGKAYGSEKTMRSVIERLKEYENGTPVKWEYLDTAGTTGCFRTKYHIITWNYPMRWLAFYRRTTKRAVGIK